MTLLRDPAESAVNSVVRRAHEIASLYEDAAERVNDSDVRRLFIELGAERRHLAKQLGGLVRAMGELPEAPDPDRTAAHRFVNAVRSFVSIEENRALIEDRERAEGDLADTIEEACAEEIPEEARRLLERAGRRIQAVREQLRAGKEGQ